MGIGRRSANSPSTATDAELGSRFLSRSDRATFEWQLHHVRAYAVGVAAKRGGLCYSLAAFVGPRLCGVTPGMEWLR